MLAILAILLAISAGIALGILAQSVFFGRRVDEKWSRLIYWLICLLVPAALILLVMTIAPRSTSALAATGGGMMAAFAVTRLILDRPSGQADVAARRRGAMITLGIGCFYLIMAVVAVIYGL